MKYITTVFLIGIVCYPSIASIGNENLAVVSGSITGNVTNAINAEDCANGAISLDIASTDGPFYIEWSNGGLTEEINNLSPGEYCVTVTDDLCGEARGCWEIKCCPFILEDDQIQYDISNPACVGILGVLDLTILEVEASDFPLTIYLENLSDNTKYDFEVASNTSTFTDLPEGLYMAQLNYGEGCTYHFEFEIELINIEIQLEKTPACDNDGTIQVNAFEGTEPYTYAWSDDDTQTGSFRSGLNSKFYTVTVSDVNLCTASSMAFIKASEPIILDNMSVFIGPSECSANTGIIQIDNGPEGGSEPYSYEWSNGASGELIEGLPSGTFGLTITDVEGCMITTEYIVPNNGQPIITNSFVDHTCAGLNTGVIGIFAIPASGGLLEYIWSNGSTDIIVENLYAGYYTVTITDQSTECEIQATYEVEALSLDPIVITENVKNICEGDGNANGEIEIGVTGGQSPYEILWNTGQISFTISSLPVGEYNATITDYCGNIAYATYDLISDPISIEIEITYPNFEENYITPYATGGSPPYEYEWNTGSNFALLFDVEDGTYTVTVTDQNGCTQSESIDVLCEPVNFQYATNFTTVNCYSPFTLIFDPSQNYGQGPFSIKVEEKVNQEYVVVDFTLLQTEEQLLNYSYHDSDTGNFRVTATNYCGYSKTEYFSGCIDCDYHFYSEDDNYFASVMNDLLIFELECPCSNDCGIFGFTTDKVKLKVNQNAFSIFDNINGYPTIVVNWPTGPASNIYHSANQNKYIINGPGQYVLTDDEFDSGITISTSLSLPFGVGEICNLSIPFKFGYLAPNGYFIKWGDNANPFSNHEPPFNWGTVACLFECKIPIVEGVLYENEPTDYIDMLDNYNSQCDESNEGPDSDYEQFFFYYPDDYDDPCDGGGRLLTHYETAYGIAKGEFIIPPNVSVDSHINWYGSMIEDNDINFDYTCPPNTYEKGYCLFESEDVYGVDVNLNDYLIVSYCKERFYDPPLDTDGDGIPDEVDPCPFNPDVFCNDDDDDDDDGSNNSGGSVGANGCYTNFHRDECKLSIICPDEEIEYVEGTIQEESFSGLEPCVHCFTADICRVTDPHTGEEYASVVGPVINIIGVGLIMNSPECPNSCAYLYTCILTSQTLGIVCTDNCSLEGAWDNFCPYGAINDVISLQNNDDGSQHLEYVISENKVMEIINLPRNQKISSNTFEMYTYPNPSSSGFGINIESSINYKTEINIKNILGEVLYTKSISLNLGSNEFVIDDIFVAGLYMISILDPNNNPVTIKHIIND